MSTSPFGMIRGSADPKRTSASSQLTARVLYIGGSGRSGSTLLDRILSQATQVVAVGELAHLWDPGHLEKHVCGCGEPLRTCAFWSEVMQRAYGGWDSPLFQRAWQLRPQITRHRRLPFLVAPTLAPTFRRDLDEFGQLIRRVYVALAIVTGARVIVDSSKEVAYAYVLRRVLGDQLRLLHLIRDGHGVAYSWTKIVDLPQADSSSALLPRYTPVRMAARWVGYNLLLEGLQFLGSERLTIRYEDLIRAPLEYVPKILDFAGLDTAESVATFLDDEPSVNLQLSHSVAGNPMRFRQGRITLKMDDEWRSRMPARERILVSAVASPLLFRYGYLPVRRQEGGRGSNVR